MGKYRKSRMFHLVTRTWNPITGCLHGCLYCWSRKLVEERLKYRTKKYREGFKPKFHVEELKKSFRPNEFVFVSDMGDAFGWWVPDEWILRVLEHIMKFPKTTFLLLTKNPKRYIHYMDIFKKADNIILGCTIETNDVELYTSNNISQAPTPDKRISIMRYLSMRGFKTMISIEPILDFKLDSFVSSIKGINPMFVYVGYDNYNNRLPEPPLNKTLKLIRRLREEGILVYKKTVRRAWFESRYTNEK